MKSIFKIIITSYFILATSYLTNAQIAINSDGTSPDASAMLDVTSTDKGILIPRMTTTEREAINSPATGLLVYDTDKNSFWYYESSEWTEIAKNQYEAAPMQPEYINYIDVGNSLKKIEQSGNYLYILDSGDDDLDVYDISNPTAPTLASSLSFSSADINDITIHDNYAYITSGNVTNEFKVIDISDPTNISLASEHNIGSSLTKIEVDGNYAYVLDGVDSKLRVIDISTPSSPSQVEEMDISMDYDSDEAMTIEGNYLYVAFRNTTDSLAIIDISVPTALSIVGSVYISSGQGFTQIIKKDNYVYTCPWGGIVAVDVSTPASPSMVNSFSSESQNFTISGDYLFSDVTFSDYKMEVYDISNPTAPTTLYDFDKSSSSYARDMLVANGYLYSAEGDGNLYIYQVVPIAVNVQDFDGGTMAYTLYDDLGDHTAENNLQLNGNWLSNDGGSEGISISDDGNTTLSGTLTIGNTYTLPNTDGAANEYLATDGSGALSWTTHDYKFISENDITHSTNNDDDFVFGADSLNHGSGTEAKFFFNNSLGAFRAGTITGTNWDESSLGDYSVAFGYNNMASGDYSFGGGNNNLASGKYAIAYGSQNTASGQAAISLGINNTANGNYSVALGYSTIASGNYSFAMGNNAEATASNTIAMGDNAEATANSAIALGNETVASGNVSTAFGSYSEASGTIATAFGLYSTAPSYGEVAFGLYNTTYTPQSTSSYNSNDRLLVVGNGSSSSNTSDALIIYKNGNAELNGELTVADTLSIKDAYTFPMTDGSASQILTTDGSGALGWTDFSLGNLTDADNDTKIQIEESSDEDIIRFDLGGTEFLRLDSGRIQVTNTGYSIFLGNNTGTNDDFSNNANVFIGNSAGRYNTSGYYNVALGNQSGTDNTTGYGNVSLGYGAGHQNAGNENVFLGYNSGYNEAGSNKLYIENSSSSSPLIYGEFDNDFLQINGTLNINNAFSFPTADGNANQILVTDGSGNLTWSTLNSTIIQDADNDTKIQVEESADEDIIRFDLGGTEFMKLNNGRIEVLNTGGSIFIGENAGQNDDLNGRENIAIGENTLQSNSAGAYNVVIGHDAGASLTGYNNLFIGNRAAQNVSSGTNNVVLGKNAGSTLTTGSDNVILGAYAGGTTNVSDQLFIDNSNTDNPLIWGDFSTDELIFNGDVGIGTSPTKAKLEIDGYGSTQSFTSTHGVLTTSGANTSSSNTVSLSIYASSNVAAKAYIAFSDARIKNIKGISNSKNDLNTLMDIQITDYTMKDTIAQGNEIIKKVIAQQVAEVYPQAVNANLTDVIPNIYQRATIDENGWIELSTELKQGDKVQIYFDDKKELLEVLEINENAFRVATIRQGSVFVYGKQVNDFHTVDYEAISMLNVSATQELAKKVEILEKENQQLKSQLKKINQLEVMLQQLQAQLENQNQ